MNMLKLFGGKKAEFYSLKGSELNVFFFFFWLGDNTSKSLGRRREGGGVG